MSHHHHLGHCIHVMGQGFNQLVPTSHWKDVLIHRAMSLLPASKAS